MEEKTVEIYNACERIRAFTVVNAHMNTESAKLIELVRNGSVISSLIDGKNWGELFENKDWLSVLKFAYDLNFFKNQRISPQLKVIAENFPEETSTIIIAGSL